MLRRRPDAATKPRLSKCSPIWSAEPSGYGNVCRPPCTRTLPGVGNSAAFREFAWRFTNIVARALVALGRRPDYQQIARHITHIEPLLVDYCRAWLPKVAPGWEQEVAKREADIQERNLPFALKGRSHQLANRDGPEPQMNRQPRWSCHMQHHRQSNSGQPVTDKIINPLDPHLSKKWTYT